MKILVDRFKSNEKTTLDKIFIDDKFQCYGLEDEHRIEKVWGETRIPEGIYNVKFRKVGKYHQEYLKRFPKLHVGMLHVTDVPGFKHILIHIGNTEKDTAGCLLVGKEVTGRWSLLRSKIAYKKLYKKVSKALTAKEKVTIEYQNNDL